MQASLLDSLLWPAEKPRESVVAMLTSLPADDRAKYSRHFSRLAGGQDTVSFHKDAI
jgi:hypothetical protein